MDAWASWDTTSPTTCSRGCGTYALTISFTNAKTVKYTIEADFWKQARETYGFFEWDNLVYADANHSTWLGSVPDSYDPTSRTGAFVFDFTPSSGTTYYYEICLRVAVSGSSDEVLLVRPQGGENRSYTAP